MQQILLFILLGLGSGALIAGLMSLGVCAPLPQIRDRAQPRRPKGTRCSPVPARSGRLTTRTRSASRSGRRPRWPSASPGMICSPWRRRSPNVVVNYVPYNNSAPLAKLVASLGVLLVLQASLLLGFGTSPQNEPEVLPRNTVAMLGAVIPLDRFVITGIVIVAAAALSALYRFTRFGVATRAASENEVSAMLSGLSPNRLSMTNSLLAAVIAGGVGILAASITELDTSTLPLQIVPALAAALLAGMSSCWIACAAGFRDRHPVLAAELHLGAVVVSDLGWHPAPRCRLSLLAFLIVVAAMFLRNARLPARGQLIEPRPARSAASCSDLLATSIPLAGGARGRIDQSPVRLPPEALRDQGSLKSAPPMALSLVVISGHRSARYRSSSSALPVSRALSSRTTHAVECRNPGSMAPLAGTAAPAKSCSELLTAVSALRVAAVSALCRGHARRRRRDPELLLSQPGVRRRKHRPPRPCWNLTCSVSILGRTRRFAVSTETSETR